MRTIVCSCNTTFPADLPDSINLDEKPQLIEDLRTGVFMSVECPTCGRRLKPEYTLRVEWPSKNVSIVAIPELDRPSLDEARKEHGNASLVVGYPELADRIAVLQAGLDAVAVETLKYYLLVKAAEADPNADASAWFYAVEQDTVDFHVHGLRPGEVAVSKIPRSIYERTLAESQSHPQDEPFKSVRNDSYISVRNLFKTED